MIHGIYYFGRVRVACRNAYCTTCQAPRFVEGLKSLAVLHLCFIPILPCAVTTRWFCSVCHREIDARRPSRPWILAAGAVAGLLVTFIGLMVLIDGHSKQSPWQLLLVGPLGTIGLLYLMRKQNYAGYVVSRQNMPPLSADHCPYCQRPLPAAATPHCPSCRVDILIK